MQPLALAWGCKSTVFGMSPQYLVVSSAWSPQQHTPSLIPHLTFSLSQMVVVVVVGPEVEAVVVSVVALAGWCGSSTDQKMNGPE